MPYGWNAKQIRSGIDPGSPAGGSLRSLAETGQDNKIRQQQDAAALQCRSVSLIGIKRPAGKSGYRFQLQGLHGMIEVSDFDNKDSASPVRRRTGIEPISAVKMPERLTEAVDAWAEAHRLTRADAICKLIELGLKIAPPVLTSEHPIASDATRSEKTAVHEIETLLDPALPADERERRIRRLTEGPPEFSQERIDLPKDPPKHRT